MSDETPPAEPAPQQAAPQQPETVVDQRANAVQTTMSILESAALHRESVKKSFETQRAELNQLIEEQKISGQSPMSVLRSSMTPSGIAGLSVPQPGQSPPLTVQNPGANQPPAATQPTLKQAADIVKPIEQQAQPVDPAAAALEKLMTALYQLLVMQLDPNNRPDVAVEAAAMQQFVEGLGSFVIFEVQRQLQAMVHTGTAVEVS